MKKKMYVFILIMAMCISGLPVYAAEENLEINESSAIVQDSLDLSSDEPEKNLEEESE